jgi:ribosomal-protein-alanine N-acetyltransferase
VDASPDFPVRHRWPVSVRAGEVVLRPLTARDELGWETLRVANQRWTARWDATLPPEADEHALSVGKWLKRMHKLGRQGSALPWALAIDPGWPHAPRPAEHCQLIGQVSVANIIHGSARSAAIGYWIDEGHAGRGLMPRAVALAADYCWQVLRLHRIEIAIRPENIASLRVVEKLGFREEGLRPRFLHIAGDWRDHRVFALNREEVPPGGLLGRITAV